MTDGPFYQHVNSFGTSPIDRWDAVHHEVTIELEWDVVSDVQERVRRTRVAEPDKV